MDADQDDVLLAKGGAMRVYAVCPFFQGDVRFTEGYARLRWKTMCSSIDVLTAVRLREGMLPVGSPGLSWIFAGSQKSTTPLTPSGPRLAAQAAGPSTRPDEAGVTFPRCDTLPGITSG